MTCNDNVEQEWTGIVPEGGEVSEAIGQGTGQKLVPKIQASAPHKQTPTHLSLTTVCSDISG